MESLPTAKGFLIWISSATQAAFYHSVTRKPPGCKNDGACSLYQIVIKRLLRTPQTRINTGFLWYFVLFPLVAENHNLTLFVYKPCDVVFVLF